MPTQAELERLRNTPEHQAQVAARLTELERQRTAPPPPKVVPPVSPVRQPVSDTPPTPLPPARPKTEVEAAQIVRFEYCSTHRRRVVVEINLGTLPSAMTVEAFAAATGVSIGAIRHRMDTQAPVPVRREGQTAWFRPRDLAGVFEPPRGMAPALNVQIQLPTYGARRRMREINLGTLLEFLTLTEWIAAIRCSRNTTRSIVARAGVVPISGRRWGGDCLYRTVELARAFGAEIPEDAHPKEQA